MISLTRRWAGEDRGSRYRAIIVPACLVVVAVMTALLLARVRGPFGAAAAVLIVAGATAAGAVLLTRGPRPARAAVALTAGLIGTAEAAGVLVPHVLARGSGPFMLAAALCLAAGVVLLVSGARDLFAAVPGWWRLLVVPAALAVLVAVMLTLPFAVAATSVPRTPVDPGTPGALGLAYRDVTFPASDGVQLSGWYVPAGRSPHPGRAVVLLPGSGSTRSAVLPQAAVLAGRGYAVLLFDPRGHGDSDGTAMDFGWYGNADVSGAVTFLTGLPGIDPAAVGAVGMSMGGEEAIGAAAADRRIRAVVAEGATNRVADDKAWQAQQFGAAGSVQGWLDEITYGAAGLLTAADQPATLRDSAAQAAPRPLLLITAGNRPDESFAADYIRAGSPASVSLWNVPGAEHIRALATDPAQWPNRVDGFLSAALR